MVGVFYSLNLNHNPSTKRLLSGHWAVTDPVEVTEEVTEEVAVEMVAKMPSK